MRSIRVAVGVAMTVGALVLVGCAPAADTSELAGRLAELEGVQGAVADVGHPGAPWNTEVVVRLFLDAPAPADLTGAVREAAPLLAEDETTAAHGATIIFIDGRPEDYANSAQAMLDKVLPGAAVYEELGIDPAGGESIRLTPADFERLASGS